MVVRVNRQTILNQKKTIDARMHFLAGDLNFANTVLSKTFSMKKQSPTYLFVGQSSNYANDKKELNVTQRLRLDPNKFEDLEKKICASVKHSTSSSRKQSSQLNFAILVTSPTAHLINVNSSSSKQRRSNGRGRSPSHPSSSDENDERPQSKRNIDDDSSLSHLITYLAT